MLTRLSVLKARTDYCKNYRTKFSVKTLLTGLFILLPAMSLQAAESTLTLPAAVKRALAENPSLKVFKFREQAAKGEIDSAGLRPAYELGVEAENFVGSGNFTGVKQTELTVALSSVFEMGAKRDARLEVAGRKLNRVDAQMQLESLELLGEVTRRYIDVLSAQERVTLAGTANELAKQALLEVRKRANAGATPEAEVRRAEAAAAQAHLAEFSEQKRLAYLKVSLASLWGGAQPDFTVVEGDLYRFGEDASFDALYGRIEQNPQIQMFASEQRLKDAELRLARSQGTSDVSWSVGVRRFQEVDDTALVAGFSVPLFAGKRNKGRLISAEAAKNEVGVRREIALLKLRTQLYHAFSNRQQAIHTADDLRKDIVPALEQALKETREAYGRGRYSYIDYVSARQELLSARRTQIDAATAALRYGADIEQLIAEPLAASQSASPELPGQAQ